jgi:hypothetical protein
MSRRFNEEFWTMVEGGQSVLQAQAGVRLKVRSSKAIDSRSITCGSSRGYDLVLLLWCEDVVGEDVVGEDEDEDERCAFHMSERERES